MGFEAMPRLADLEIAATWDEIELEAALKGSDAEAQARPIEANPSRPPEAELARAVQELKQLPKAERKQRAEELLRALTGAPPAQADALEACPIPRFLATECSSLELERADSLIPFHAVAAACALAGAALLIYFGSPQATGLAARTVASEAQFSTPPIVPAEVPPSVAVRQAFVSLSPIDVAGSEVVRSYRPPFVGFDYLDDAAPPVVAAKAEAPPAEPVSPVPVPAAAAVALPPAPGADLVALIKRGDELLKAGDVAAARSAYERAAASGSARAQIGVGKTYDPLVLAKLGARGVRGDPVQAAAWYARAGEAGDAEGQQRLHALISGLSDCLLAQAACTSGERKP